MLFENFSNAGGPLPEPGEHSEIGISLGEVLNEIDEIAVATLRSISISTFLKTMLVPIKPSQPAVDLSP